jgi:hypothetical protein
MKPTDAPSSNFIIGNNNITCFGQSFCPSSGASQPYNGTGTVPIIIKPIIPIIKLELSASVGFIHNESVTMRGHTVLKFGLRLLFMTTCSPMS